MICNNRYTNKGSTDYGPRSFVVNINRAANQNNNYRSALWTGNYLQLTLMSIQDEIGIEVHSENDQFFRIEDGYGLVMIGNSRDALNERIKVNKDSAIFIPAGTWHNLINMGNEPLKLYSIYAPPQHPKGTVHKTKADSVAAE